MSFLSDFQVVLFKDMDIMSLTIVLMFASFIIMFWHAQIKGDINWIDLIRKPGNPKISLTKLLQLVGGLVSTWIMVKLAMKDHITWDLFAIYLAYVASIEGYSKFITAKYGLPSSAHHSTPKTTAGPDRTSGQKAIPDDEDIKN